MSILNYIQYFINEGKHFRNILIYNSNVSNVHEMDEIGKLCNSVTFSYDNNFLVSSYSIRLRFNRNIKITNSKTIFERFYMSSFDLVIMDQPDNDMINLINQNKFVQYFIILDNSLVDVALFEYLNNGIYKRNLSKVIVDVTKEEKQYNENVEKFSALDKILNRSKKIDEISNSLNKDSENNVKTSDNNINSLFSTINVVNLVPHETKYIVKHVDRFNDGILAICMVISSDDDFEKFSRCKSIIMSQYENIKYYIALNGQETIKFMKYFNDSELLIKSMIKEDNEFYYSFFDKCIDNEYQFNLNNFNEYQLTNIWGLL
jgi:hypothetical protein